MLCTFFLLSFSIEPNYDFLYIYDGPHTNSHLIGTFQDSKLPEKIESSSNIMHIGFRSDGSVSYTGFHLEYKGEDGTAENRRRQPSARPRRGGAKTEAPLRAKNSDWLPENVS